MKERKYVRAKQTMGRKGSTEADGGSEKIIMQRTYRRGVTDTALWQTCTIDGN